MTIEQKETAGGGGGGVAFIWGGGREGIVGGGNDGEREGEGGVFVWQQRQHSRQEQRGKLRKRAKAKGSLRRPAATLAG